MALSSMHFLVLRQATLLKANHRTVIVIVESTVQNTPKMGLQSGNTWEHLQPFYSFDDFAVALHTTSINSYAAATSSRR